MTVPIREISEAQAREIALQHLGFPPEEVDRVHEVSEGSTEDERYELARVGRSYFECEFCWIAVVKPLDQRGPEPDGPVFVVWVDQRTGNIAKVGQI